jgi:hypothetical protein
MTTCKVSDANGQDARFTHNCDVSAGQHGAPMWEWQDKQPGQFCLRAVMAFESVKVPVLVHVLVLMYTQTAPRGSSKVVAAP